MPGLSARSAYKNMSKAKRSASNKNTRRVAAALANELEMCTYGKIVRACGNKMFMVLNSDKKEHLAHIRGKMSRICVNDIVLLNIRDYETRADSDNAVYDIMAVFEAHDVARLIKAEFIPTWMTSTGHAEEDETAELFDYTRDEDSEFDIDEV